MSGKSWRRLDEGRERNSALYWHPRVRGVEGADPPSTIIVPLEPGDAYLLRYELPEFERVYGEQLESALEHFSLPVFVRTDELSGKHDWKDTCYVEQADDLYPHLKNLAIASAMVNERFRAVLFREMLDLEAPFEFFRGGMPVARERRYFVRGGEVACHHPYWDEGAFQEVFERDAAAAELTGREPRYTSERRKEILQTVRRLNEESRDEVKLLSAVARRAGRALGGAWSIDFARDRTGGWHLIDCALAADSWHPEDCPEEFGLRR
jgi:hypothetical protein